MTGYGLLEASRFDEYMDLFTDDCVMQFEVEIFGKLATRQYFEAVMERLADIRHEVLSVIETDDAIAADVRAAGTPSGPLSVAGVSVTPKAVLAEFIAVDLLWLRDGTIAVACVLRPAHDVHLARHRCHATDPLSRPLTDTRRLGRDRSAA